MTVWIIWQESDATRIDIVENFAKPALRAIQDEYGVNITWVSSVDSSIQQLAATGTLPDIFFGFCNGLCAARMRFSGGHTFGTER